MTATVPRLGTNPYVGPRAFTRGETLYGRDREVLDLIDLVVAERIVLLYSPSGAGKTSLLQAALIPALEQQDFVVPPVMRVGAELPGVHDLDPPPNRYVLSALSLLETAVPADDQRSPAELGALSFVDYLDQAYPADEGHVVLVFDQLEEVMTLDPTDAAAKIEFFRQLGEVLRDRRRWAVLAMREDFVAGLDPYLKAFPAPLARRYRLDLLGPDAALVALTAPAQAAGVTFDEEAASALVDDLRSVRVERWGETTVEPGPYVEPVQLQVAGRQLWARREPEARSIGVDDVTRLGDLDDALGEYYDEQVALVTRSDSEQRVVRDWVDAELITEHGFRSQAIGGPDGVDDGEAIVHRLVDSHLVRSESRRGTTWYELAHDRLVGPISHRNAAWRQSHLDAVELQAALWETEGRPDARLLGGPELAEGKRWAEARSGAVSPAVREFLDRSEGVSKARTAGRYKRVGLIAGVLALIMASVAAGAGWLAARASDDADRATTRELIGHSTAQRDTDQALSTLLALEAYEREPDSVDAVAAVDGALNAESTLSLGEVVVGRLMPVTAVAYAPDGRSVATGGDGVTATIWDVDSGQRLTTLRGHGGTVIGVAFAPDGQTVATASADHTAIIWDAATGEVLHTLDRHTDWIRAVAFSPDGRTVATASDDKTAIIWDTTTGQPVTTLRGHTDWIRAVAFSPDGRTVATASDDKTAIIWDTTTGQPVTTLRGHTDWIRAVAFSPDGRTVATASDDKTAIIWDTTTGQPVTTLRGHTDWIKGIAFSPDGQTVATASDDTTAVIWDTTTGQPVTTLLGHTDIVNGISYAPDGQTVATASDDTTALIWDTTTGQPVTTLGQTVGGAGSAFALSGDRQRAALAAAATVGTHDLAGVSPERPIDVGDVTVTALAFTASDSLVVTGDDAGGVRLWGADTGSESRRLFDADDEVASVAASRDGRLVAVATTASDDVEVVDLEDEDARWQLSDVGADVVDLAFEPDGEVLVVGRADGVIGVWDAVDGEPMGEVDHAGRAAVTHVATGGSAGSWRIAAAYEDGTVSVAEAAELGATIHPVERTSEEPVVDVALDAGGGELAVVTPSGLEVASADTSWQLAPPDGLTCSTPAPVGVEYAAPGMVAIAAADGSVHVCATERSASTTGTTSPIYAVAVDSSGEHLATGDDTGAVTPWDLGDEPLPHEPYGTEEASHRSYVNDIEYSPDGTRVASASGDGRGAVWDEDGTPTFLVGHADLVLGIDFSPDGRRVATASRDGTVAVWDPSTGEMERGFDAHEDGAWDVTFSPDGDVLASVGEDERVRLWDAGSGEALGALPASTGHTDVVYSVTFDPHGDLMATTSADGTAIVWDMADREAVFRFDDHNGPVLSVAFDPAGSLLATASDDSTVLLYDLDSGDLVRRIELSSPAYSVAFTPDGEDVVVGTGSGRVVVAPVATDELVERARERAGRELTADECEQYLHRPDCAG